MLQVMQSRWKTGGLGFMKTHPSPADRIKAVEKGIASIPAPAAVPAAAAAARTARYQTGLGKL